MSTVEQRNKEVIARYFTEYWGNLNPDIVDEVCADDVLQSYPMHGNPKKGKAAVKQAMVDFKTVNPDSSFLALKNIYTDLLTLTATKGFPKSRIQDLRALPSYRRGGLCLRSLDWWRYTHWHYF
jgi:SnoaL-like polyketide cyclase